MKVTLSLYQSKLLAKHNVSNFEISAQKLRNKLIQVVVDWRDRGTVHSFKYVKEHTIESSYDGPKFTSSVELSFCNKARYRFGVFRFPFSFTVSLAQNRHSKLKYNYQYFKNTKYGVVVYFAPDNFNDMKNAENISAEIV